MAIHPLVVKLVAERTAVLIHRAMLKKVRRGKRPLSRPCSPDIIHKRIRTCMIMSTRTTLLFIYFNMTTLLWIMQKGNKYCGKKEVLRVHVVNPVEAAHYSQMYDSLMHIWGHVMCISWALLSFCFMAKDGISQPFKLHTASLKQSSYSAFFSSRKYVSWAVIKIQFHMYDKLSREVHSGSVKYDCGVFDFCG